MSNSARCLFALVVIPSLALAQAKPPPSVSSLKIDAVKALPMPQGIRDPLVFRGPPAPVWSAQLKGGALPTKGLSPADKLALVRRAAGTSGAPAAGSAMGPYLMLSRANMRTEGRGQLTFWQAPSVTQTSTVIGAQVQRGAVELEVYPDSPGRLYLAEWQVSGNLAAGYENRCRMSGSGAGEQTVRLNGDESSMIPVVFESASTGLHGFRLECSEPWRFISVEVSALR